MLLVAVFALLLVTACTILHYEVLRLLKARLDRAPIIGRWKVLVVMFATLLAHWIEIALFGAAVYVLVQQGTVGGLSGAGTVTFLKCLYYSAETYTSLGFGDVTPTGPVRLLAGIEALNGLLLIAWSASFAYLSMERYWDELAAPGDG